MAHRSKRIKFLTVLLPSQPEEAIDDVSFSEENNVEELSDIESEEDTYGIVEDVDQPAESKEQEAAHASTRGTEFFESRFIYALNGFEWSVTPPTEKEQTEADKVSNYKPDVRFDAKNKKTPVDIWSLLFTDNMLNNIVKYTNAKIARKREGITKQSYILDIEDLEELKAFIGILYFSGLHGENNSPVKKIWKSSHASPNVYHATMSVKRFQFLSECLQFDEKSTREERCQCDHLAPIRDIWDSFISNCRKYYSPSKHVTIGEQFLNYRGDCPFRVSLRGFKIVMMNDSETSYMINAIPYLGKVDKNPIKSNPSYYVCKLSKPIYGSHRNITCNEPFISVPLVQTMKNFSLSMVGTIKPKDCEIPPNIKKNIECNEFRLLYTNDMTIIGSYCPEENIIVLSSLPQREVVVDKVGNEVDIIQFYNSTKGGTDTFDQACRKYSTARKCQHWPIRFFYAMLDQGGYNSFQLYSLNKENEQMSREEFLKSLAINLITPFIKGRWRKLEGIGISDKLRKAMGKVIKGEVSES